MNIFPVKKKLIMDSPKMEFSQFSSWVKYPDEYKFFSVHFELSQDILHFTRRTYDLMDFARDMGGINIVLVFLLRALSFIFARLRLQSLLTNRLFYLN